MVNVTLLLAAVALAGVYALRAGAGTDGLPARTLTHRRAIAAAAGISVAYVFVDILPELAEKNQALRQAAGESVFAEQRIYLLALISFVVMYGIDHIVLSRRDERRDRVERGERAPSIGCTLPIRRYSALTVPLFEGQRAPRSGLYAGMAVHSSWSAIPRRNTALYRAWTLGTRRERARRFGVGQRFHPAAVTVARLFALLAGGVDMTSLRAELPDDRNGRFWPFCLSSVAFAAVLLAA
jgi:hypothetical protein